ncbi:MAG: hypothetical protein H0X62_16140 [Bacteroidetes bacterium]|nr:hypothetical protein [Bacteroidota bacterium]
MKGKWWIKLNGKISVGGGFKNFSMSPGSTSPSLLPGFFGEAFTTENYVAQGWIQNLEFNFDRFIDPSQYTERQGLIYGLSIGFTLSPVNMQWRRDGQPIPQATPTSLNTTYLSLKIGIGRHRLSHRI